MKRILHLLLGLGITVLLVGPGYPAPVQPKVKELHELIVKTQIVLETAAAVNMKTGDQVPATPALSFLPGDLVADAPAFTGFSGTSFARSNISYDPRKRRQHQANLILPKYYITRPLITKPDPGRYSSCF